MTLDKIGVCFGRVFFVCVCVIVFCLGFLFFCLFCHDHRNYIFW